MSHMHYEDHTTKIVLVSRHYENCRFALTSMVKLGPKFLIVFGHNFFINQFLKFLCSRACLKVLSKEVKIKEFGRK